MKVIKRDGQSVEFDASKIEKAILKAMQCGSGIVDSKCAHDIAVEIENWHQFSDNNISIYRIEGQVFEKLIEKGQILTAKAYEGYRKVREFQRETNTIDKEIYGIVNQTNKEAMEENSNKDATVLATQRDLIAGEFSKDYCRRLLLPPKIVQAHDDGIIHFHDMDYYIQKMHNCDLVNLKDMFAKGTVIPSTIPKRFFNALANVYVVDSAGVPYKPKPNPVSSFQLSQALLKRSMIFVANSFPSLEV